MKGIVFTEFFDMIEEKYGYEVVDSIIGKSSLDSGGVYTAIGTYHHSEIVTLLLNLSDHVNVPAGELLEAFGKHLFHTFHKSYPQFFSSVDNSFDFLESIDRHIHVEVKKLYPDATLPKFETEVNEANEMTMIYKSERKMAALAHGLIQETVKHYKEDYTIASENLSDDGSMVKFTIAPNG